MTLYDLLSAGCSISFSEQARERNTVTNITFIQVKMKLREVQGLDEHHPPHWWGLGLRTKWGGSGALWLSDAV